MGCIESRHSSELFTDYNWFIVVKKGDIETVKIFIKNKFNINVKDNGDKYRKTALMYAVKIKNIEMVKLLIESGANLDVQNKYRMTALMYAVSCKNRFYIDCANMEIIRLLIESGANLDVRDKYGMTALMYAVSYKIEIENILYIGANIEIIRLLIESGANLNIRDKNRKTALVYSLDNEIEIEITKLLIQHGADINIRYYENIDCPCLLPPNFLKNNYRINSIISDNIISKIKDHDLHVQLSPNSGSEIFKEAEERFNEMKEN